MILENNVMKMGCKKYFKPKHSTKFLKKRYYGVIPKKAKPSKAEM